MTMISEVQKEFDKIEKQMADDNRKLELLRMVIKEFSSEEKKLETPQSSLDTNKS